MIPLSVPNISGNELKYVKDCIDTGWISSAGSYVDRFEKHVVAEFVGSKYGIATMNGTSGLHIALLLSGVKPNDYVIVSNLTFVASVNSIKYLGADPILIDADVKNWQMDLDLLEEFLDIKTDIDINGNRILKSDGRIIKTIMPVHIQGNIFDMDRFKLICKKYKISFIEDAAEALGSKYKGKYAGTFGKMGIISFNGNKIISSGGGGVIVTNDKSIAKNAKHLTTTAKVDPMLYFHDKVGYNYRLVNILAAVGVAQMEKLPEFIIKKKFIGEYYRNQLSDIGDIEFQYISDKVNFNDWLFTIKSKSQKKLLKFLNKNNIMSRPFWMPMNQLPMYEKCHYVSKLDNSKIIHDTCLSIPCSTNISNQELKRVVSIIKKFFQLMYHLIKRLVDIVFSLILIVLLFPIFIVIIIILKFSGDGEVFYLQERVGYKNKNFKIYKFATMIKNSPNLGSGDVTLRNDPRVTYIGKYLRKSKINELPQIINVLFGDITLVGPRPLMKPGFDRYALKFQKNIYNIKPGLTGIGSIVFRDEENHDGFKFTSS